MTSLFFPLKKRSERLKRKKNVMGVNYPVVILAVLSGSLAIAVIGEIT